MALDQLSIKSGQVVVKNGQLGRETVTDCCCAGGETGCTITTPPCDELGTCPSLCNACIDCVPPSMTLVVTGGDVAGTYVLPYIGCDETYGTSWGNGTSYISKGGNFLPPSCVGSFASICRFWKVHLEKGCEGYWSDFVSGGCNDAVVVFPMIGGVATAVGGSDCPPAPCSNPADSYSLVITGMGCLDGTYVLPRTVCDDWGGVPYLQYDYADAFISIGMNFAFGSWSISISGAPATLFDSYICPGPTTCSVAFEFTTQPGYTVDWGTPVSGIAVTPAACTDPLYEVACAPLEPPQCPLCAQQGTPEPKSYKATINAMASLADNCLYDPYEPVIGVPICLAKADTYNRGTSCAIDCHGCNQQSALDPMGWFQAVIGWNWLVSPASTVDLCYIGWSPYTLNTGVFPVQAINNYVCTMVGESITGNDCPLGAIPCVDSTWGLGGSCEYKSTSPVATVDLGVIDVSGFPWTLVGPGLGCFGEPPNPINIYLVMHLYGSPINTIPGIPSGQPNQIHGASIALIDDFNVLWGAKYVPVNQTSNGCCKPCASKFHFCTAYCGGCMGGTAELSCDCGTGMIQGNPSQLFTGVDIVVEPCAAGCP